MTDATKRSILRWIHIIFGLPILGYIYGPPAETIQYLPYFRYIYVPVVLLTGLCMWKGAALRRLVTTAELREGDQLADALRAAGVDPALAVHATLVRDRLRRAIYGPRGPRDVEELTAETQEVLRALTGEVVDTAVSGEQ